MSSKRPETRTDHRHVYESALDYVAHHHTRTLTLDDVARQTMTSSRQLQRILAERGTSFRDLLHRARTAHGAKLLQTDMPIADVARAVGYVEPARFSKAFRKRYGCSPSAWRRQRTAAGHGAREPWSALAA